MTIPVIDLTDAFTPCGNRRRIVVDEIRGAAETCGFFYVSSHQIPADLIARQFDIAEQFFTQSPMVKETVALRPGGPLRGYESLGSQTLDATAKADVKESFQCGIAYPPDHPYVRKGYSSYGANIWPEGIEGFQDVCESYLEATMRLSTLVLELLAESLDLPQTYFNDLNRNPSDTLRLLWYPPHPENADERTFGAGAHTDWGAVTILAQDASGGLQVRVQDGSWVSADPIENTFLVNLGDMIPRWTNGRYRSNCHRVINKSARNHHRQSLVVFTDLDFEAVIVPIAGAGGTAGGACTVGEHMAEMVSKTYG